MIPSCHLHYVLAYGLQKYWFAYSLTPCETILESGKLSFVEVFLVCGSHFIRVGTFPPRIFFPFMQVSNVIMGVKECLLMNNFLISVCVFLYVVCLDDGQTEAERTPLQGGSGDAQLRRMPPYLTFVRGSHSTWVSLYAGHISRSHTVRGYPICWSLCTRVLFYAGHAVLLDKSYCSFPLSAYVREPKTRLRSTVGIAAW